mmetsp:Transcript_28093/g.50727  ORF Transcript_28093/g.50727 Transcript_28093/m.50727 type:complete len:253 (+) Transcript_28093:409-1167(+)
MNVVLGVICSVVVDNKTNPLDVKSTCCHIRSNEDSDTSLLQAIQCLITLALVFVPMDCGARNFGLPKIIGQLLAHPLRARENKRLTNGSRLCEACFLEQGDYGLLLGIAFHHSYLLCDILVRLQLLPVANHYSERLPKHGTCQLSHFSGPSCREKHCVTLLRNVGKDFLNLRLETHIQHAISLVQHQLLYRVDFDRSRFDEVVQTARASNDCMNPLPVKSQLISFWSSTVHRDSPHANALSKTVRFSLNLLS